MVALLSRFTRFYFDELPNEQAGTPSGIAFIDVDQCNADEYEDELVSQNILFTRVDF
jgi:hypothetical protein